MAWNPEVPKLQSPEVPTQQSRKAGEQDSRRGEEQESMKEREQGKSRKAGERVCRIIMIFPRGGRYRPHGGGGQWAPWAPFFNYKLFSILIKHINKTYKILSNYLKIRITYSENIQTSLENRFFIFLFCLARFPESRLARFPKFLFRISCAFNFFVF